MIPFPTRAERLQSVKNRCVNQFKNDKRFFLNHMKSTGRNPEPFKVWLDGLSVEWRTEHSILIDDILLKVKFYVSKDYTFERSIFLCYRVIK